MKVLRPMLVGAIALSALTIGVKGTRTAAAATPPNVTCSGSVSSPGILASGTYGNVTVAGFCSVVGTITVTGNINVAQGSGLDAAFSLPSLTVNHSILVWNGGTLILGCSTEIPACSGNSGATVKESIIGTQPLGMLVHNTVVGGNVSLAGGGGGFDCVPTGAFAAFGVPVYSDFEDNRIAGNALVTNYRACYFGFIRNHVGGNATFIGNTLGDPDAMEVSANIIRGSLGCLANNPAPHLPFEGGGSLNTVRGFKKGQCKAL